MEMEIEMFQASLKNMPVHVRVVCTIYPPDTFQINNNNRRTDGRCENNNTKLVNYNRNYNFQFHFHDFRLITNKSHNPWHNIFTIKISNKFLAKADKNQSNYKTRPLTHTHLHNAIK